MKTVRSFLSNLIQVLLCVLIALFIGSIFLLFQGEDILKAYYYLLIDPLTTGSGIIKLLAKATPLIFTGMAVAISFRCGIFNIGVEGQLMFGGLASALAGYYFAGLPAMLHTIVAIGAAMLAGALYALIPALLKVKLNVHEVIVTIMMNSIASALVGFIIVNYFRDFSQTARTYYVADSARLAQFMPPEQLNTGFVIAVFCAIAFQIIISRTPFGLELDAAGKNMTASEYSGINTTKIIIFTMMLSGAVAGLCGAERVLGAYGYMLVDFSPGYGFDGITVAIIGKNHLGGVLVAALFIGLLQSGATSLNMMTKVPYEWVQALIAVIFIIVATQDKMFRTFVKSALNRGKEITVC